MPILFPTYGFESKTRLLRSYFAGIGVGYDGNASLAFADGVIHLHNAIGDYFLDTYISVFENWLDWSSNAYTLDYIFTDEYTEELANGIKIRQPVYISWTFKPGTLKRYVVIVYGGNPLNFYIDLGGAPPTYWLP